MITPEEMHKKTTALSKAINEAKSKSVAVGLPEEKIGGAVYGDGQTVLLIGARHEFGFGNNPQRSFLRVPFRDNKKGLAEFTAKQFKKVFEGGTVDQALGLIGVYAQNISKKAFATGGYGKWPDIKEATKKAKRKDSTGDGAKILVDTRILAGSVTWVIRRS